MKPIDKPSNSQWKQFCQRTIEKEGKVSTKDAKECGIPFGYFFELMCRLTLEQLKENAKRTIAEMERRGY